MNNLLQLLDVNTIFFTVLNYPMSYVEFFGTLFNIACVYLVARKNIWTWPTGIVAVALFAVLFYQLNLYADMFEQVFYIITGFWGWYAWSIAKKPKDETEEIEVKRNSPMANIAWITGILMLTITGTWAMSRVHVWLPALFPAPASLPLLDVGTTIMSFAAQILLIQKRLENWILWIIVDVIAIGLYWYKGVMLVSILYMIFLVLATMGLINWYKTYRRETNEKGTRDREVLPAA